MRVLFAAASVLVAGEASRTLFSTPTMYTAPKTSTYGASLAPNVPAVESTPYFQPVIQATPAFAVKRDQPAQSDTAFYAAAALLCGAMAYSAATRRQPQAIAELDPGYVASAANVAMLFSSGSKAKTGRSAVKKAPAKRAPAKKPAAKKAEGTSPFSLFGSGNVKPTAKTTARKTKASGRRSGQKVEEEELPFAGQVVVTLLGAPLLFVKAFFSEENWAYQAFMTVKSLPESNSAKNGGKRQDFR